MDEDIFRTGRGADGKPVTHALARNFRDERQDRVRDWMMQHAPGKLSGSRTWTLYMVEKVIALCRAVGISYPEVMKLAASVYTDPTALANSHAAGEIGIGLLAYGESLGFSGDRLEELALERLIGPQPEPRAREIAPEPAAAVEAAAPPAAPEVPELPEIPEEPEAPPIPGG